MTRDEFWSEVKVATLSEALGRSPETVKDWPSRGIPGTELLRVMEFVSELGLSVPFSLWHELSTAKRSRGRCMA